MATVRNTRKAKGWSQAELASRAGVSSMTIVRIERGNAVTKVVRNAVAKALETENVDIRILNRVQSVPASK